MAHEVGHLWLDASGHSAAGIMKPHWSRNELELEKLAVLRFNTAERRRMSSSVQLDGRAS